MRGSLEDLSSRSHSFLTKDCTFFCYHLLSILPLYKERLFEGGLKVKTIINILYQGLL